MNSVVGFNLVGLNQFEIQEIKDTELICLKSTTERMFQNNNHADLQQNDLHIS